VHVQLLNLAGKDYVVLERGEYERLADLVKAVEGLPVITPDEHGNYPAVAYGRASIARSVIRDRAQLGLSRENLAKLAGIRMETLLRLESGRHTPSVATVDKIDRALRAAGSRRRRKT